MLLSKCKRLPLGMHQWTMFLMCNRHDPMSWEKRVWRYRRNGRTEVHHERYLLCDSFIVGSNIDDSLYHIEIERATESQLERERERWSCCEIHHVTSIISCKRCTQNLWISTKFWNPPTIHSQAQTHLHVDTVVEYILHLLYSYYESFRWNTMYSISFFDVTVIVVAKCFFFK